MSDSRLPGQALGVETEVVVLTRDFHVSTRFVTHRMVSTVVPERQLERGATECSTEQLVTEADPEHRHFAE